MRILLYIFCAIFLLMACKRPDRSRSKPPNTERNYSGRNATIDPNPPVVQNPDKSETNFDKASPKNISDMFQDLQKEVFMVFTLDEYEQLSQGSGFFIAPGIGITNAHVLEDSEDAVIKINDNFYKITSILQSSNSGNLDYVIFETNYRTSSPLKVAKRSPRVGDEIFAIGSPKGLSNSLTKGTVSGLRANNRIQIDATIDHGSSGGPLFNLDGEVIGITTSGIGTGSELNFAVDIQALPYNRYIIN
ncbi:S1C family serine protease [Salegentibacter sp. HM20]